MSTPENETPPAPPVPPPQPQVDPGFDLALQAFNEVAATGNTVLAAKIGGAMARISWLLNRVAELDGRLDSIDTAMMVLDRVLAEANEKAKKWDDLQAKLAANQAILPEEWPSPPDPEPAAAPPADPQPEATPPA